MKNKVRFFGLICSIPFALFFGFAIFFVTGHISQLQNSNAPTYMGSFVFCMIVLLGIWKPISFIGFFRFLKSGSKYDDGGIFSSLSRWLD